ncbi:hypothetical protein SAY86_004909 [Trapa natans]|uniref:Expansin-like CBD domain-containing protein n=1 Tax=Trapa natans TaxID=22666 RepID=A0AAN7MGG0_TRANT|nr:hypothetical protein SAY86_004909 [Trapa natans]
MCNFLGFFSLVIWEEQADCQEWKPMRRAFWAVFDTASPPRGGDISVRFQVCGGSGVRWIQPKNAIPGDGKAGATYSIGIQLD